MLSISIDLVSPHWLLGDGMAWQSYTFTAAQLAAAALTNTVTLTALPAKTVVHAVVIKHSAAFGGGTIATYTVAVGITGSLAKYATAFDVFQAPGAAVAQVSSGGADVESFTASANLLLTATATGGNLNTATTGSVTVWVLTSVLP